MRRILHCWAFPVLLALIGPSDAIASSPWEELAVLSFGDGPGGVGRTPEREDELAWGPHGIAARTDGAVAVVDRVHGRVLVLAPDGALSETLAATGHPAAVALLPDGRVVVTDEQDERTVSVLGLDREVLQAPRWALPPARLSAWTDPTGAVVVEGLDALQNRLPLGRLSAAPGALERGLPAADGGAAVWAVRRGRDLVLGFDEIEVVVGEGAWPALPDRPWRPGSVTVLAASDIDAIVALESISADGGPLEVRRVVTRVHRDGRFLDSLETPAAGPLVIPADLAALPDGTVWVLVSGDDGCRLLRTRLGDSP